MQMHFVLHENTIKYCQRLRNPHEVHKRDNSRTTINMKISCSETNNFDINGGLWAHPNEYFNNIKGFSHEFYYFITNINNENEFTLLKILHSKNIFI